MSFIHTTITASTFENSDYFDNFDCALAKTLSRVISEPITVGRDNLSIGEDTYTIDAKLCELVSIMCYVKDDTGILVTPPIHEEPKDTPIVVDNINKVIKIDET